MTRRLSLLLVAAAVLGTGCGGDDEDRASSRLQQPPAHLRVSSPAFINGARLQEKYTCDGAGEQPVLSVGASPVGTSELVLIVSDPDAAGGTFVHLTRYGLSPGGSGAVNDGGVEGRNSAGKVGWTPPCPPAGSGTHRYTWNVYALRDKSGLAAGADPAAVRAAVSDPLASGSITAIYARQG
ncbi:MAG: YbhB/YbcL family Raf kinase inhibitor-like protein [Solirubrobacteraceae bacterium]|nr:YbhB/YbcL family Raf kinase inhibitor-like protein [Solirubrobacteraceae bacterium]